ncbi:MAG: CocE/NonD family hydrolase, partial [Patescibacteria group bacterium]
MKNLKLLFLILLCAVVVFPLAAYTKKSSYQTFERHQFKIKVLKNWKKKSVSKYVKLYPKKTKKVSIKIKQVNLKKKGQNYLKKEKVKKFAKIYKKKIKKEYKADPAPMVIGAGYLGGFFTRSCGSAALITTSNTLRQRPQSIGNCNKKLNLQFLKAGKFKISNYKVIRLDFSFNLGQLNVYYTADANLYHQLVSVCKLNDCSRCSKNIRKIIRSFRTVADTAPPNFAGAINAKSTSTNAVSLSWTAASDNASLSSKIKYLIYQANQLEEQNFTLPTYTTSAGATACTLSGQKESTSYYFVVRAQDEAGNVDKNTQEVIATTKAVSNDDPAVTGNPQYVTYQSNGSNVKGLMYRPQGEGPFPAIIYNHGGVTAWDSTWSTSRVQDLTEGGKYVVLATAYRGDIGSEGDLSINIGDVNDILAGIEYLKSKSYVDANRIGMFGESRGGASTLSAAERNNSDLKAVVTWYPYVNLITYCLHLG